jgi:hypothetical protein
LRDFLAAGALFLCHTKISACCKSQKNALTLHRQLKQKNYKFMITKTRILSLGVALLPWLAMLASADLEVTKWGGDNDYDRDHVGVVPPVDIMQGE